MFIIIGVYVTAVNVTKMNAEYDKSRACLKDPGKMSWHKNQLVNSGGCVTPTTMSCISSKELIIPRYSHWSNYLSQMFSCGVHAYMNFSPFFSSMWRTMIHVCLLNMKTALSVRLFSFLPIFLTYMASCHAIILPSFN